MKDISLHTILGIIKGSLIKGDINTIVKGCVHGFWAMDNDNTMYFHLSRRSIDRPDTIKKYKNIIIVTETPDAFIQLEEALVVVKVANIYESYWKFVDFYRNIFDIPVIGITGTCGKSTTTKMINHILSKKHKVVSTPRGLNSCNFDFSYLTKIDDATEAAVFEMGVDIPGNLIYSCRHFKPQIRILLNIGVYHILGCKTLEGYIKAKAELLHDLNPESGILIISGDDENIKKINVSKFKNLIRFGLKEGNDFRAVEVKSQAYGISFELQYMDKTYPAYVPGLGRHNVYNALAAIAAVINTDFSIEEAIETLKTFEPMPNHLQLRKGPKDCTILDDNWNNTPPSMTSALEVLKEIAEGRQKIAVFGYMYNLGTGTIATEQYSKMGEKVVEAGVDILVIIGDKPEWIAKKAIELGMSEDRVIFIDSGKKVLEAVTPYLNKNTIVLLKACEDDVVL